MKILIRDRHRNPLFTASVDARRPGTVVKDPAGAKPDVALTWDNAIDDGGFLRRCPVCGCREMFVRKDFSQRVGLLIVILTAAAAMFLFVRREFHTAMVTLAGVAVIDAIIFLFVGRCLVCYRCRSEFRDLPISKDHHGWDLSIGEKYRLMESSPDQQP